MELFSEEHRSEWVHRYTIQESPNADQGLLLNAIGEAGSDRSAAGIDEVGAETKIRSSNYSVPARFLVGQSTSSLFAHLWLYKLIFCPGPAFALSQTRQSFMSSSV